MAPPKIGGDAERRRITARSLVTLQDRKPVTAQIAAVRAAARAYTPEAMRALVEIVRTGKSEASRIAAANAILDRAHGKPSPPGEAKSRAKAPLKRIERVIVDPKN